MHPGWRGVAEKCLAAVSIVKQGHQRKARELPASGPRLKMIVSDLRCRSKVRHGPAWYRGAPSPPASALDDERKRRVSDQLGELEQDTAARDLPQRIYVFYRGGGVGRRVSHCRQIFLN